MKKKQKLKIEVEVWNIEVEETQHYENGEGSGWWSFDFSIRKNGGKKKLGSQDGSWSSQTKAEFTRTLRNGFAAEKALESYF